jgi:hypothetical protein
MSTVETQTSMTQNKVYRPTNSKIEIQEVKTGKQIKEFLALPH